VKITIISKKIFKPQETRLAINFWRDWLCAPLAFIILTALVLFVIIREPIR
jgi:hypothetical protein